jgi:hypothetical protein
MLPRVIIGPSEDKTARHQKQSGRGRLSAADKHLTQPACTLRHGRGSAGLNAMDRNIYARAGYWTLVKLTEYFLICASSLLPQQLRQLGDVGCDPPGLVGARSPAEPRSHPCGSTRRRPPARWRPRCGALVPALGPTGRGEVAAAHCSLKSAAARACACRGQPGQSSPAPENPAVELP